MNMIYPNTVIFLRIKITRVSQRGYKVTDQLCNLTQRDCKVTPGTRIKIEVKPGTSNIHSYIRSNGHHFSDLTF